MAGAPAAAIAMPMAMPMAAPASELEPAESSPEHQERWGTSGLLLLMSLVVMGGLHLAMPGTEPVGVGRAIVAGIIHTFAVMVGTLTLLVSMAVALRITGGSNPGMLDKVLAKSILLVLALAILDFFGTRNESLWMLLFGFRGVLMILALIVLFDLDFFDTMIVSAINMVLGWMLAAGLAVALMAFANIGANSSHELSLDEDGVTIQQAMPTERELDGALED
jgi:hypothetical protein